VHGVSRASARPADVCVPLEAPKPKGRLAPVSTPRISVVVPMHNAELWIEETLESVVRQTISPEDMELLVIDDASRDTGAELARSFLERHGLAGRVISCETNIGVSAARNVGWREANGTWIQFLDADDLLVPGKLQLQMAGAAQAGEDVAVVYSDWRRFGFSGGRWQPIGPLVRPDVDRDTVVRILQDFDFGYVGPTLIRRSSLSAVGGFDERLSLGEDIDLLLRIAMAGGRFARAESEGPAFLYRVTHESLGSRELRNVDSLRSLVYVFRRVEEFLRHHPPDRELSHRARASLARRYTRFIDFFVDHDPEFFRSIVAWLNGLGLPYPPDLSTGMRALVQAIGYTNALRLKRSCRRNARRFVDTWAARSAGPKAV